MKTLSTTLSNPVYSDLENPDNIVSTMQKHGIMHRFEHPHRRWEYGITMSSIDSAQPITSILDVGGGGSIFAPWVKVKYPNADVLQVDPGDVGQWIKKQSELIKLPLEHIQEDFITWEDKRQFKIVTCLSVIEHVPNHLEFFDILCEKVEEGGLLILTTDFHPSGGVMVDGHLRTYNKESMNLFIEQANKNLLVPYGGEPDYDTFQVNVNSYTFASLVLKKDFHVNIRNTNT